MNMKNSRGISGVGVGEGAGVMDGDKTGVVDSITGVVDSIPGVVEFTVRVVVPGDGEGVITTPVLVGVTNGGKVEEDGVIDTKEKQILNSGSKHHIMHMDQPAVAVGAIVENEADTDAFGDGTAKVDDSITEVVDSMAVQMHCVIYTCNKLHFAYQLLI